MKYPIGIQNFGEIREGGYVYIDKTPQTWKMISEGNYYFLSRPRRFGKSLMVSTLEAFFSGKREWFKGVEERFLQVVRLAYEKTGRQVVILIDEYDKPLLQAIGNEPLQAAYRSVLKPFYGVLKSCDRYIKLAFLTGVTKSLREKQNCISKTHYGCCSNCL